MAKVIQTFCSILFCTVFFICVNHCLCEKAAGIDLHEAHGCGASDDADHHHHETPCASIISLATKTDLLIASDISELLTWTVSPVFQVSARLQKLSIPISAHTFLFPPLLLSSLSRAPNAPPVLF